ncbi:MAG: hypothetical protein V4604_14155 [Bacteroidota bacterium]
MNNQLRVDNPCPMMLSRMSCSDGSFSCKSCKTEVIDFRGKSAEEIKRLSTPDTCGIFTTDQLPGQQNTSVSRKLVFYALAFCSFLGFNVSPVYAVPKPAQISETPVLAASSSQKEDTKKPKKKKKVKRSKKSQVVTGCPSF